MTETMPESTPRVMSMKEQKDIVATVTGWKEKIKTARTQIESQWNLNIAFYGGKQNVRRITAGGTSRLIAAKAPYWRNRAVFNHIRPLMRTELSKMTSQKPSCTVIPGSNDDADIFAAEAGTQIWDSIYTGKKLDRTIRQAAWWSSVTGTGFIKTLWDPTAVDKNSDQLGDLEYVAETPYNVYVPDFTVQDLEDQPYLIHAQYFALEKARNLFSNVPGFDPSKLTDSAVALDDPLNSVWNEIPSEARKKSVEVLEAWIKPGYDKRWPGGAMITIADEQLVQIIEGWPYEHGMFPFSMLSGIPNGKFYRDSTIVDLIPIQMEYNRTRNQIIEAKNLMAKPQLMAPQGSIDASKITSEPGQVILYKPGLPAPTPLPLQPLPNYVLDEVERLYRDFEDISGQHEISKGTPPAGVTAATAISFLSEQDDAKLTPQVRELEVAIEVMGHQTLSLVVQFWDTPRIVKTVGTDNSFSAVVFKGSDLRGNTDVRVEAGSALSNSKAARQAFIMDLMKMQFIPVEIGLELLEMGNVASLYERVKIDERQADRENLKMSTFPEEMATQYVDVRAAYETIGGVDPETGEPIMPPQPPFPVNDFDDHGKHIDAHNRYRKSQSYEQLSDTQKAVLDEHVNAHVIALTGGDPAAMVGSTQPQPDSPTTQMQDEMSAAPDPGAEGAMPPDNYSGPEQDSVTGSQQPPEA